MDVHFDEGGPPAGALVKAGLADGVVFEGAALGPVGGWSGGVLVDNDVLALKIEVGVATAGVVVLLRVEAFVCGNRILNPSAG